MAENRLITPLTPELVCRDIATSLSFYVGLLGFSIQYQRVEHGFAMLENQGSRIMLIQYVSGDARKWVTAPLEPPFGRGINFQMEINNVDALYAKITVTNTPIFVPIEEKWYRADDVYVGNRQFLIQDPDGYLLRFFQHLGERNSPASGDINGN